MALNVVVRVAQKWPFGTKGVKDSDIFFVLTVCGLRLLFGFNTAGYYDNWAASRENLSSGFPTKRVSNQSPQLQRLARKLKFHL